MRSIRRSRRPRGATGARFALGAAALLGLVVAQVVETAGAGDERTAATSAKVTTQLKKLKRRVAKLEGGPAGPAGGELGGSYPNPTVDDTLGFTQLSVDGPCPNGHTGNCPGQWNSTEMSMTRKDGSPTAITYTAFYNGQALGFDGSNGDGVFLSGSGFLQMHEASFSFNPPANEVLIYPRDLGGQTQLVVRYNDGEVDILAVDN